MVLNDDLKDKKIIDFDVGENIVVLLLETHEVYWMGLRLAYKPELLKLAEDTKVRAIAACHKSAAVLTGLMNL